MPINTYNFPTKIHAGVGARTQIGASLKAAGSSNPLIVTDKILATLEPIALVKAALAESGFEPGLFAGIWGNPLVSQVAAGVQAYKDGKHDAVVAVGGGAALDVAKCIALMAHHPGTVLDYEDGKEGALPVDQHFPFVIAVPTTAGTGSEVGRASVVSEDDTKKKRIIFDAKMLPSVVCADAELTLGLPAKVTAATGLDALTHLAEAFLAKGYHPMCDGIALEGIAMVAASLEKVVAFAQDPDADRQAHLAARDTMLQAALMGAVAFQKGLGVTHSCAHALSTVVDMHHGLANGILMPTTMAFNLEAVPERFARMARAAGAGDKGEDFVRWVIDLNKAVGIPATLGSEGVTGEHIDALVDIAIDDPCHPQNPRPVSREDFRTLYERAIG